MSANVTNKTEGARIEQFLQRRSLSRTLLLQPPDRVNGDGASSAAILQLAISRPSVDGSWLNFKVKLSLRDREDRVSLWVLDLPDDRFPEAQIRWFVLRRYWSRFLAVWRRRGDRLNLNGRVSCQLYSIDQGLLLKSRTIDR
jgi:hypothetical protein